LGLNTSSSRPKRIGVFGGAFDPPHRAHVALAQTAIDQLQLDVLHVVPTGHAWHKSRTLTNAVHRLAMTEMTFAPMPAVVVDPRETLRSGPTYTVDTLREIAGENPGAQLYLIIGEDQALALPTWQRWEELPRLAIICVAARADSTGANASFDALKTRIPRIIRLEMPATPLSATTIRHAIAHGQSVESLVFEPVARYIEQHHLYRSA
jgi:nicotinate-nucleotide adenylyltransferase